MAGVSPAYRSVVGPIALLVAVSMSLVGAGCKRAKPRPVVTLYTSVDEPFVVEVINSFEKQTGVKVQLVTDTEAGKTTGLVRRIEAERDRPQADVFWSSELFNTIRLARAGLLAEYRPPAEGITDRYKDPAGKWTAFGLRARVIAYNTARLKPEQVPTRWRDIAETRWKGQLAIADPRFGTTTGHFAAMYALWGEQNYIAFLKGLAEVTQGKLMDGNATAARRVGAGEALICATDTDDVYARQNRGEPVALVYPDMGDGGTLLIPNSVGLIAGAPHPRTARRLIDFLTSAETERMLARSDSRNVPVRASLREELTMDLPPETAVSFEQIAGALAPAMNLAGKHLIR